MTTEDVSNQFKADLQALLAKYSDGEKECWIKAEDHWQGWGECGEDIRITVYVPGIWDSEGNEMRPYTEIDLDDAICLVRGLGVK